MRVRFLALLALLLSPTTGAGEAATPIPASLRNAKPHEVVERVLAAKADLSLSDSQVARLTDLHERIADEPHRFKHDPTRKPHDVTHARMVGRQEAFDSTVAVLTPPQRQQLQTLFAARP